MCLLRRLLSVVVPVPQASGEPVNHMDSCDEQILIHFCINLGR
jgi:hypothetical protein